MRRFLAFLLLPGMVRAQTDEIQVYDATIADQGHFEVEFHNNCTPIGRKSEFGLGHGFTAAYDDLVLKLMIGLDF